MKITFDPAKREATLKDRGLDFAWAAQVFAGETIDIVDNRKDYGETRIVSIGRLGELVVIIVWTERGDTRRVISMRKANDKEKARYWKRLGEG